MFQANIGRVAALGVVGLALAGCDNPAVQGQETGINLRSAIGSTCTNGDETLTFDLKVWADNTGPEGVPDGIADEENPVEEINGVGLTDVFNVGQLNVGETPAEESLTGIWVGGDEFILLEPGTYIVEATAVGTSVDLLPGDVQTKNVTVVEGQTTEVVFAYQCEGQTISALDVAILVNQGPSIVDWTYSPNKFAMRCETTQLKATFANTDPASSTVTVTFEMYSSAQIGYTGPRASGWIAHQVSTVTAPANGGEFSATWNYSHPAAHPAGTYYVYVTVTDNGGAPTTFQALYHAYDPIGGYVVDDSPFTNQDKYWGLNSCEQGDRVLLNLQCAKLFSPMPLDRTLVCPVEPVPQAVTDWNAAHSGCAATWEYPGDYTPIAGGNLSGQWGYWDGVCDVNPLAACGASLIPVWDLDGNQYSNACLAQAACETYTDSACAAAPPTP